MSLFRLIYSGRSLFAPVIKSLSRVCSTRFQVRSMETYAPKPLNVLVFTGETSDEDDSSRFQSIASVLKTCLDPECYIVYLLTPAQVMKDPWQENLKLLLISSVNVEDEIATAFGDYALEGGNVYISCCDVDIPNLGLKSDKHPDATVISMNFQEFSDVSVWRDVTRYEITCPHSVIARNHNQGVAFKLESRNVVISEVCLEREFSTFKCNKSGFDSLVLSNSKRIDVLKRILSKEFSIKCADVIQHDLTPCYLFVSGDIIVDDIISMIRSGARSFSGLELFPVDCSSLIPIASKKSLPVVYNFENTNNQVSFDNDVYLSFLKTLTFGRSLFFVPVVGSTMEVIKKLSHVEGSCVIAQQQTLGKGRGSNKWISPLGSAIFSLHFSLTLSSKLGERLSLIQHMVAASVVLAVRQTPGYEDIDLRLKWPNDIYYGSKVKIGGVLVTTSIIGKFAKVFIGAGVNVCNIYPTVCINDLIQLHNSQFGCNLAKFSIEQLIASSLSELEKLVNSFQAYGPEAFLEIYYKYWVHAGQVVTLNTTGEKATVIGLNEYGYLLVKRLTGTELVLVPDGNSFDMMKNLIISK